MKHLFMTLILSVAFLPSAKPQNAVTQPPSSGSPAETIRDFYHWYIHLLNQNKNPETDKAAELKRRVTARLLKELNKMKRGPDGLDGDYFVDAQDFGKDWEKNIAVQNLKVEDTHATATVLLTDREVGKKKLKVTLVREHDAWKLDKVAGEE